MAKVSLLVSDRLWSRLGRDLGRNAAGVGRLCGGPINKKAAPHRPGRLS
jgi:hypothetical protein